MPGTKQGRAKEESFGGHDSVVGLLESVARGLTAVGFLRALRRGWQGGSAGVTIVKTDKAIIIGTYGEGQTAGQCSSVVGKLGDYLKGVGY